MDLVLNILISLGLFPAKALNESMQQSKTLTILMLVLFVIFTAFAVFLYVMAK